MVGNLLLGSSLLFCALMLFLVLKLMPMYYAWLAKKEKYQTGKHKEKLDEAIAKIKSKKAIITLGLFYVFCLYVGLGIGRGLGTNKKLAEEDLKLSHELFFEDGEQKKVRVLGKNSLYVFYVTKNERKVAIAPIDGNIKVIKQLKEEAISIDE